MQENNTSKPNSYWNLIHKGDQNERNFSMFLTMEYIYENYSNFMGWIYIFVQ